MKGILFTPDTHKAEREDRKTVTRRLDGLREINREPDKWNFTFKVYTSGEYEFTNGYRCCLIKPRYQVGEVVYIKESWYDFGYWSPIDTEGGWDCGAIWRGGTERLHLQPIYALDEPKDFYCHKTLTMSFDDNERAKLAGQNFWRKISPLFMPAWAARDFIKITDVRPGRLQDISIQDAGREIGWDYANPIPDHLIDGHHFRAEFHTLWDSINENRGYGWDKNDWVWVNKFERVKP